MSSRHDTSNLAADRIQRGQYLWKIQASYRGGGAKFARDQKQHGHEDGKSKLPVSEVAKPGASNVLAMSQANGKEKEANDLQTALPLFKAPDQSTHSRFQIQTL